MDDQPLGSLPPKHSWKMRYFGVIGVFLNHVKEINTSDESFDLLDKPLSQWLNKSDHHFSTINLTINQLVELFPGIEKRTLYDIIDLLYELIHGNTEADFYSYLKKYTGIRLPGLPMDLAAESARWK